MMHVTLSVKYSVRCIHKAYKHLGLCVQWMPTITQAEAQHGVPQDQHQGRDYAHRYQHRLID